MRSDLPDLSKLAIERSPASRQEVPGRHVRWVGWVRRYFLPTVLLAAFGLLLASSVGPALYPKPTVSFIPVIVKRGDVQRAGSTLFQAAGWIEPSPTAIRVPALEPGVIEELKVVEGDEVQKGQLLARLVSVDAQLAVEQARAKLKLSESELQQAKADNHGARQRLENPLHLQAPLSEAKSQLAKMLTEKEKLPSLMSAAIANVEFARSSLEGKQKAGGGVAGVLVKQAERDYAAAIATVEELKTRGPNLDREIEALQQNIDVLAKQLNLMIDERRLVALTDAKVNASAATCEEAGVRLRQAELALQRMQVVSPIDGRILRIIALPGTRVSGAGLSEGTSTTSTVVEMYEPNRLQVRADVRLEDVPLVMIGAPVEIMTASSENPISGQVLQATSTANVQKNTLEVKVALRNPPDTVRPEMLVTASFLAPETEADATVEAERMFVPRQFVLTEEAGASVWIVDGRSHSIKRKVVVGSATYEGMVEITTGLQVTDKIITSDVGSLSVDQVVHAKREDQTIGIGS